MRSPVSPVTAGTVSALFVSALLVSPASMRVLLSRTLLSRTLLSRALLALTLLVSAGLFFTAPALAGNPQAAPQAAGAQKAANAQKAPAASETAEPKPLAPLDAVEIATRNGVVVLEMEVARTDEELTRGLMYRKSLPERHGMLFDFKYDQPIYMWMKNTYIPLDMLFIRSDGTITRIAAMTTPLSTETIASGEPVRAVIEIAGGSARRLGIAPGDKVAYPLFHAP